MRGLMGMLVQALLITAITVGALWLYVRATRPAPGVCRITYVYDGDTVALDCGTGERTARIEGLNAPETRDAACPAEAEAGRRATDRLRALVRGSGEIAVSRQGHDRYGRDLVRLWIDGRDVAATLVAEGLAEPYLGGRRRDWCAGAAR